MDRLLILWFDVRIDAYCIQNQNMQQSIHIAIRLTVLCFFDKRSVNLMAMWIDCGYVDFMLEFKQI